ncbi:6-phospho-beta-glucosidase [Clostridium taeniosporum]|uniref:6-phospho-beta-glucosidase n=1 Tax=Clostridium taeniosporum TaxID=394958 RepID=A0A1D7XJK8_9CLOT|nr:6-phospho-beta-glucosidase [Clostridium taeniosporum]AOR23370.1 6-phospho-beta-glucosidase [Clostridium taeniosporum]
MNNKQIKIVTIGGGSSYTPELIEGFIKRSNELPIREIWLVDIEDGKEKLEIVGAMAKRMVKAAKLNWKVNLTLDRKKALKDADFVTTQFRVGLLDARIKDERIPLSHGLIGQETNGAGGMFKAFRTIPVILDIIKDMKELCPNAWLINFTNPAGMITEAVIKYGDFNKTIGLCNVPINCIKQDSKALEIKEEDLFFKFGGINHFHYHRVWDRKGNERTKELIELLYNPINADSNNEAVVANIKESKFLYEQIKDLGVLPCPYHNYYYATDDMLKEELEGFLKGQTRAEVVKKTEEELFELYRDVNLDYKPEQLTKRGGAYYSDSACEVISSIFNDKRKVMVVSTLNNGALLDLPYDSVVEVSSIITSHGPEPISFGKLNTSLKGMLQLMKSMEKETILAAISGDYNKALQAFTINPLVPSGKIAKEVLNELFLAHKKYLPQFHYIIEKLEK